MAYTPLIVPDVNVFISGSMISKYAPSQVMQAWREERIEIATSELILDDLARVLSYPKIQRYFPMSPRQQASFIADIRGSAVWVQGTTPVHISPDPDDNKLFACALEAQADYIVSMDEKHVLSVGEYEGIQTIHPSNFVADVLRREKAA